MPISHCRQVVAGAVLLLAAGTATAGTSVSFPLVPSTLQTLQSLTCKSGKATLKSSNKEGANGFTVRLKVRKIEGAGSITGRVQIALALGGSVTAVCDLYNFSPVTVADGDLDIELTGTQFGVPEQTEGTLIRPCNVIRITDMANPGNELLVSTLNSGSDPD